MPPSQCPSHNPPPHIGIVLPSLRGGGAERVTLTLAEALVARGHRVDLLVARFVVDYPVPGGVRVFRPWWLAGKGARHCRASGIPLRRLRVTPALAEDWRSLAKMARGAPIPLKQVAYAHMVAGYLRAERPALLLSATPHADAAALYAAAVCNNAAPVVVTIHSERFREGHWLRTSRSLYPQAAALVAVSRGVAAAAERTLALEAGSIHTIPNPIPAADIRRLAAEPVAHPWFASGQPPVVLTVGRNAPQKDYPTLIEAFAGVRREAPSRLVVLGDLGRRLRRQLMALAQRLGVGDDVAYLPFDPNPYRYMGRAAVFVLSSRQEGLPTVLVEALACGTPVVSTNAPPQGPDEILAGGAFGKLATVGAPAALADALLETLRGDHPPAQTLRQRAGDFSCESAARRYQEVFQRVLAGAACP